MQVGRLAVEPQSTPCSPYSTPTRTACSSKEELGTAVKSLHRFDLDSDELIDPNELEPFSNPIATMNENATRRGHDRGGAAR